MEHPGEPADILRRVDQTVAGLRTRILATLLLGRIESILDDTAAGRRTPNTSMTKRANSFPIPLSKPYSKPFSALLPD